MANHHHLRAMDSSTLLNMVNTLLRASTHHPSTDNTLPSSKASILPLSKEGIISSRLLRKDNILRNKVITHRHRASIRRSKRHMGNLHPSSMARLLLTNNTELLHLRMLRMAM